MRKKILILLAILLVFTSLIGISYANWLFTEKQKAFNTLGSKCFEVTMTKETEAITISKAYPITDEEGLKQTGYTFSIKNTCDTYASYDVELENMEVEGKRLAEKYVKVSLNDSTPEVLTFYEEKEPTLEEADSSFKLTSGSLAPEEEVSYTLKLWMDEETPAIEETMNALFSSKISIEAGYIKEEQRENTMSLEKKSQTEAMNNIGEVFEFRGLSEKYNIIEYSMDKTHWTSIENPSKEVVIDQMYEENGHQKFYIKDEMGNIEEIEIEVTKVDKEKPQIKIEAVEGQEKVDLTIQLQENYELSGYQITTTKEEPTEWIEIEGTNQEISYTITENKTYYIWVKDKVGNISVEEYTPNVIDNKAPSLEIENVLTTWGRKDQIKIKATDDITGIKGISISEKVSEFNWEEIETVLEYETEKEITKNGTYYVSVKDGYDHITTKSIVIDKIDNINPSVESLTSDSTWGITNHITGTLKDNESGLNGYQITTTNEEPKEYISISGNSYSLNYEVTTNGTYYIWIKDVIGNVYNTSIEVNKIDNINPSVESLTSDSTWGTTNHITGIIKDNESGLSGYQIATTNEEPEEYISISGNSYSLNYEVTENGTYYIWIKDVIGNVYNTSIEVNKIDNVKPSIESLTSDSAWGITNHITGTLKDNESGLNGYQITTTNEEPEEYISISGNSYSLNYEVTANGNYYLWVKDQGNNIYTANIEVNKIDHEGPVLSNLQNPTNGNWTNQNFHITYEVLEEQSGFDYCEYSYNNQSFTRNNGTLTNGIYTPTDFSAERDDISYWRCYDKLGNQSNTLTTPVKIDKTKPTVGITATGKGANIQVTASNAQDNISGIGTYYYKVDNGQWYSSTSSSYTFTNILSGTHTVYVKVKDTAGNESAIASTTVKTTYTYQFRVMPGKQIGNQTTYTASGNSIVLHTHNTTALGSSVGVELYLSNMSLVNPTVSFDYKFTTSKSMYGAFSFYTNLATSLSTYKIYATASTTSSFNQQLSGTITQLYFGIDSYSTYTSDITISNLKINGELINFDQLGQSG